MERIVTKIEPKSYKIPFKSVGIYCRVSSTHSEQLRSLAGQISYCVKLVNRERYWRLEDIYIDIKSGNISQNRIELQRLLSDCRRGVIDFVVIRSVSRLSRDTVDLLQIVREFRDLGVGVMFDREAITTDSPDYEYMLTIVAAIEQAENEQRSQNTRMGIFMHAKDGTSKLYNRRCFGYITYEDGDLAIKQDEAEIVRLIFSLYLSGESLVGIIRHLEERGIKTATGKVKWSKNTLDKMLSNEKYCGNVTLFKSLVTTEYRDGDRIRRIRKNDGEHAKCCIIDSHPAIISKEDFRTVQDEKVRRSNVERTEGAVRRKRTRYVAPKSD